MNYLSFPKLVKEPPVEPTESSSEALPEKSPEQLREDLRAQMLELAHDKDKTPFDYVIIGSGAGGGPLAARLALAGRTVLLLEAGADPSVVQPSAGPEKPKSKGPPDNDLALLNETTEVPGYHAASTENKEISWDFSVRHYTDDAQQKRDTKYDPDKDPSKNGGLGQGGIFYPRCAALGGCTAHHAMIMIAPNDEDWDRIADRTGDATWGAANMQGYFTRMENCLYQGVYDDFLRKKIGALYDAARRLVRAVSPRAILDRGGHGDSGWQPTSLVNPNDVLSIVDRDSIFRTILLGAAESSFSVLRFLQTAKKYLFHLGFVNFLDPNNLGRRRDRSQGLVLIPIGTDGVRRKGVREFLCDTASLFPAVPLLIQTEVHATRLLFAKDEKMEAPCAVGVEVAVGAHLYKASPRWTGTGGEETLRYFARREVIVCGGTFNTPQLLMLSGIGEAGHLSANGITHLRDENGVEIYPAIDLPGVGANMQDRYEVTVVSEAAKDFSTLDGLTFTPGDTTDPARADYFKNHQGLLTTNGGALAFFETSDPRNLPHPDLFIFGAPVAFRGYYWSYSKELLCAAKGAVAKQRNLWSWVILKAYTHNNQGTVRLLSNSAFDHPDICFASFPKDSPEWKNDRGALEYAVNQVRELNSRLDFKKEIQPGVDKPAGSPQLQQWIEDETWGHHACGTCRMGSDAWVTDVNALKDKSAVLDSQFRVHGVSGLRVVDASVFPDIPGYFIVTPIFMMSEKAADTIIAESQDYPEPLEAAEAAAVRRRRYVAGIASQPAGLAEGPGQSLGTQNRGLPPETVGLALSGGGIRSATFCLGVLQALAAKDRLREIDFISSVSGGGYIGAFLGRLFTRIADPVADKAGRVQEILTRQGSPEIAWLRSKANYISSGGSASLAQNLAVFFRNLFTIYLVMGALSLVGFGALRWIADRWLPPGWNVGHETLSPWAWIPVAIVALGTLPAALGYWLAPKKGSATQFSLYPLLAWLVLMASAVAALQLPGAFPFALAAIAVLYLAYLWQEAARQKLPAAATPETTGEIVRLRLSGALARSLYLFVGAAYFVLLDTAARHTASMPWATLSLATTVALPFLRQLATYLQQVASKAQSSPLKVDTSNWTAAFVALVLLTTLLFSVDFATHGLFNRTPVAGGWTVLVLAAFSFVLGRASAFANLTALHATYASRLIRTFLGASNSSRVRSPISDVPPDVEVADPDDDLPQYAYHPEKKGGPLHLINVCVNQTVDLSSQRVQPDMRGLPMCVGPAGISVGCRFHSLWTTPADTETGQRTSWWRRVGLFFQDTPALDPALPVALYPIPSGGYPDGFHVLGRRDGQPADVESLTLGQWIATSGAFFTTGSGKLTSFAMSLLHGLLNIRLGYWWNSGIAAGDRPGRYPATLWQRLKYLPATLVRAQNMLLNELRAHYPGPSRRFWYLSDGGHFEVSGTYELVRRRVGLIVALDAGEDPTYLFTDVTGGEQVFARDFGATLNLIDPRAARAQGLAGWQALDAAAGSCAIPPWIQAWIDPAQLGAREEISRAGSVSACLGCITYSDAPNTFTWLLLLKSTLAPDLPLPIANYAARHSDFPNESTANQFFNDEQWEAYRALGEHLGARLFTHRPANAAPPTLPPPVAPSPTPSPAKQSRKLPTSKKK